MGEQSLVANLWVLIRHPGLVARLRLLDPIRPEAGEDRRSICARTRSAIVAELGLEPACEPKPHAAGGHIRTDDEPRGADPGLSGPELMPWQQ